MSSQCDKRIWSDIKIGDNVFIVCVLQKNNTFEVFLTNLIELWVETLTEEIILQKCRKLNPLLDEAFNPYETVSNIIKDIPKHVIKASLEEINLHARIDGGTLKFCLNLSKGTKENFWEYITKPLFMSSTELVRQHKILSDLIKKKDAEIAEYKREGAELIRKYIETTPFTENTLKANLPLSNIHNRTNDFQAVINFYNTIDIPQSIIKVEDEIFSTSNEEIKDIDQLEQTATSINDNFDSSSESKELSNISMHVNVGISPDNGQSIVTCQQSANNKTKNTNEKKKSTKKLKKNLNDFI